MQNFIGVYRSSNLKQKVKEKKMKDFEQKRLVKIAQIIKEVKSDYKKRKEIIMKRKNYY